jgi:hypothetical protein
MMWGGSQQRLQATWWALRASLTRRNECFMLELPRDRALSDSSRVVDSCTGPWPEFSFFVKPEIQRVE